MNFHEGNGGYSDISIDGDVVAKLVHKRLSLN